MPVYLKNKEIRELYLGSSRIREAYLGNRKIYQYDSAAPELLVTAPSGTAASAPTYTTSGTYRVQGTVMDSDSGVAAVYVNNTAAVISGTTWYCDISLTANSTATVQVYAIDNAGNRSAAVVRYVRYDSAAPFLSVSAPAGTSSSSPTYVQSDSAASYTVSGTVSDASGIASVTVNGQTAAISGNTWSKSLSGLATNSTHTITVVAKDKAGRTTTVNRYLRIEAYYQYASRLAGGTPQASLDALLRSSAECAQIAGNATACSVIKSHYGSTANDYNADFSRCNNGLNFLLYKMGGYKYWLYRQSGTSYNDFSLITGGYGGSYTLGTSKTTVSGTFYGMRLAAGAYWYTKNDCVNLDTYKTLSIVTSWPGVPGTYVGTVSKSNVGTQDWTYKIEAHNAGITDFTWSSYGSFTGVRCAQLYGRSGEGETFISEIYVTP